MKLMKTMVILKKDTGGRGLRRKGVDFIDPISARTRSRNNIPTEKGKILFNWYKYVCTCT